MFNKFIKTQSDEMDAMIPCSLLISLLEWVPGMDSTIPSIIDMVMMKKSTSKTSDLKFLLNQLLFVCIWASPQTSLNKLESENNLAELLNQVVTLIDSGKVTDDFEVTRISMGINAMILNPGLSNLVEQYRQPLSNRLVALFKRSVEIRQLTEPEQCEDDGVILADDDGEEDIPDDDEDYIPDGGNDNGTTFYDSKLEDLDEVFYFRDELQKKQGDQNVYAAAISGFSQADFDLFG